MTKCTVPDCRLAGVASSGMAQLCGEHDNDHLLEMLPRVIKKYPPHTWYQAMKDHEARFGPVRHTEWDPRVERAYFEEPKPNARAPERSVVYFLVVGDMVKIGTALRLGERMDALNVPPNGAVRLTLPGSYELEAQMHRRFHQERHKGTEWFTLSPRLRSFIETQAPDTPPWQRSPLSTGSPARTPTASPAATDGIATDIQKAESATAGKTSTHPSPKVQRRAARG